MRSAAEWAARSRCTRDRLHLMEPACSSAAASFSARRSSTCAARAAIAVTVFNRGRARSDWPDATSR